MPGHALVVGKVAGEALTIRYPGGGGGGGACDCQLTVKHILLECVDFIESRNRHFSVNSFRELFEKVPPDSILSYLHEIGLFYRLQNFLRIYSFS